MQPAAGRPFAGPLPAELAERARALDRGELAVSVPRPASTVVLLRDTAGGIEVYLLRRVRSMAFAAGMHVFPGGGVDPRDADDGVPWCGPDPQDWASLLSADPLLTRALACAAIRETFEECGVLLAAPQEQPHGVLADCTGADWEHDRQALLARELAMSDLLARRGLVLRADLLGPWAHWITPALEPRRYDTRFFVAALPAGQQARHVGGEAVQSLWMRPDDAARAYEAGRLPMLPPTIAVLRELAGFATVGQVLAAVEDRPIRAVEPQTVDDGEHVRLVFPGDKGYPDD